MFTPLESPGIYAGDLINRKHQLLVKAGSKPHLSNGVYLNPRTLDPLNPEN
jgi:hypothetical protein